MSGIAETLKLAGLLPAAASLPPSAVAAPAPDNLLPLVLQAWSAHPGPWRRDEAARRESVLIRLARHHEQGASLTYGIPGAAANRFDRWLGNRLAWWPRGVPTGRFVGVVSSRLGQALDRHKAWFTVLRAVSMKIDPRQDLLVTAEQTTAERFVQRCGELFGLRVLSLELDRDDHLSPERWGAQLLAAEDSKPTASQRVCISPELNRRESEGLPSQWIRLPAADRAVAALSERLVVLHARRNGNLDRLLRARLKDPTFPAASVFLALGSELVPRELAGELMGHGAVGWLVLNTLGHTDEVAAGPWTLPENVVHTPAPVIAWPRAEGEKYLTHCTRRRRGPWPGEAEADFLDDLILDRAGADHSAWAALWRIVQTQRLMASAEMIRGGTPVVSFTAVPLGDLPRLRGFRPHLARWDFEPYGICLRRDWLESRGARSVRYGDDSLWQTLPAEEQAFFQRARSATPSGTVLDWSKEQEWRHLGDLPLRELPAQAAFLFVPSVSEARQLALVSPWPVATLT